MHNIYNFSKYFSLFADRTIHQKKNMKLKNSSTHFQMRNKKILCIFITHRLLSRSEFVHFLKKIMKPTKCTRTSIYKKIYYHWKKFFLIYKFEIEALFLFWEGIRLRCVAFEVQLSSPKKINATTVNICRLITPCDLWLAEKNITFLLMRLEKFFKMEFFKSLQKFIVNLKFLS